MEFTLCFSVSLQCLKACLISYSDGHFTLQKFIEKTLNLNIEEDNEPSEPETKEESASGASPLDKYMKIIQKTQEEEDKVKVLRL